MFRPGIVSGRAAAASIPQILQSDGSMIAGGANSRSLPVTCPSLTEDLIVLAGFRVSNSSFSPSPVSYDGSPMNNIVPWTNADDRLYLSMWRKNAPSIGVSKNVFMNTPGPDWSSSIIRAYSIRNMSGVGDSDADTSIGTGITADCPMTVTKNSLILGLAAATYNSGSAGNPGWSLINFNNIFDDVDSGQSTYVVGSIIAPANASLTYTADAGNWGGSHAMAMVAGELLV